MGIFAKLWCCEEMGQFGELLPHIEMVNPSHAITCACVRSCPLPKMLLLLSSFFDNPQQQQEFIANQGFLLLQ